jgi:hypothetical protein
MFVAAVLRAGTEQVPVKVRNISSNGAMVDCPLALPPGTNVELVRGSLSAKGKVMWCSESRCGLRFVSDLLIKEWLSPLAKVEQERVNAIVSLVKSGGAQNALAEAQKLRTFNRSSEAELLEGLSDVIKLLQSLEEDLSSSPQTLSRHGPKLQNLDIAIQMTRAIMHEFSSYPGNCEQRTWASLEDLRLVCALALHSE